MAEHIEAPPVSPADVAGLKSPGHFLDILNAFMRRTAGAVNGLLTLDNLVHEERVVELTAPSEWVPLVVQSPFEELLPTSEPTAVRKIEDGTVHLRLQVRSGGDIVDGSLVATLPEAFRPDSLQVPVGVDSANYPASFKVMPSGELQYRSGDATLYLTAYASWPAQNRLLPPWPAPVRVTLGTAADPFPGSPRWCFVAAVEGETGTGIGEMPTVPAFTFARASEREKLTVTIPRINGLTAGVRYRLTLLFIGG